MIAYLNVIILKSAWESLQISVRAIETEGKPSIFKVLRALFQPCSLGHAGKVQFSICPTAVHGLNPASLGGGRTKLRNSFEGRRVDVKIRIIGFGRYLMSDKIILKKIMSLKVGS